MIITKLPASIVSLATFVVETGLPEGARPIGEHLSFLSRIHRAVVTIEPWGILFVAFALVLSVFQFWLEYEDRVNERAVRAWQLVTTSAPGNSGKRAALEYLNKEDGILCFEWLRGKLQWFHGEEDMDVGCLILMKRREKLVGLDLTSSSINAGAVSPGSSGVFLEDIDLRGAILTGANLNGADLRRSNFTEAHMLATQLDDTRLGRSQLNKAYMFRASLKAAHLDNADLTGAVLNSADLTKAALYNAKLVDSLLMGASLIDTILYSADFTNADLNGANLKGARLDGANLSASINLSQSQLDQACGDERTKLPEGLTVQPCE